MDKAGEGSYSVYAEPLPALESLLLLLLLLAAELDLLSPTGRLEKIIFCGAGAASLSDESFSLGAGSGRSFCMLGDDGDEEVSA